jgi:sensor histidine kinase regulating citrate/malate metabolism
VDGSLLSAIEPTDIYTLFGNAIDNAIECVMQYPDEEKRILSLYVAGSGELMRIHFENYCERKITVKDGEVQTSKDDPINHGFGLKSIRFIAEKYGGYLNVQAADNVFTLDVLIPQVKK